MSYSLPDTMQEKLPDTIQQRLPDTMEERLPEPLKHADMSFDSALDGSGVAGYADVMRQDAEAFDNYQSSGPPEPQQEPRQKIPVSLAHLPVTVQRPPYVPTEEDEKTFKNPGTARVNQAATASHPNGTEDDGWNERHADQTVLQQHVDFWDTDKDGVIWPLDTYRGFRAIGFNVLISAVAMVVIHLPFSYPTVPGFLPDPLFRIYLANIHKTKHGSDSGTYDNEGRFLPQKFEDFFAKYGKDTDGDGENDGLDAWDIWNGTKGQRVLVDPFGWTAVALEWLITYLFLWPEDGIIRKDDVRRVYDGSIFYEAAEKRSGQKRRNLQKKYQ